MFDDWLAVGYLFALFPRFSFNDCYNMGECCLGAVSHESCINPRRPGTSFCLICFLMNLFAGKRLTFAYGYININKYEPELLFVFNGALGLSLTTNYADFQVYIHISPG